MAELRLPIFPLPDVVFFPDTVLPLHVFEPRYRRMIADCLAGDRRLAVAMLRPGWERDYHGRPPVHAVAGAGEIIQAEALADGRYNILLDGQMRVRIAEELTADQPYRLVRARPLADVLAANDAASLGERLGILRAAYAKLLDALGQVHADLVGRLTVAGAGPGAVIDRIVSAVVPDAAVRQQILEAVDVGERLDLATVALSDLLTLVAGAEDEDSRDD
ncbi:MAG TPA: LON peptidase substrate-binding domain-containing protein [Methylomirabilota bacterium]|nr:LON peptidase substrate-binding domain-containing protein [Methylomirabilota bacterium]